MINSISLLDSILPRSPKTYTTGVLVRTKVIPVQRVTVWSLQHWLKRIQRILILLSPEHLATETVHSIQRTLTRCIEKSLLSLLTRLVLWNIKVELALFKVVTRVAAIRRRNLLLHEFYVISGRALSRRCVFSESQTWLAVLAIELKVLKTWVRPIWVIPPKSRAVILRVER